VVLCAISKDTGVIFQKSVPICYSLGRSESRADSRMTMIEITGRITETGEVTGVTAYPHRPIVSHNWLMCR
jgi:hypothetical protein